MKRKPTYDDANLILRLFELRREDKMREARDWFVAHCRYKTMEELNQACPPGSATNAYLRMVSSYWEMVAGFITAEVLNPELFFQSGMEMLVVYERLRALLPQMRQFNQNPMYFHNLETVSKSFIEWLNQRAPEAHAAFVARIG
ncbi:MAG: hypothetical protein HY013_17210 [Candidatus Solibacter usitatus]|nr:hypothetical protein [Candidatus Solibacter usitatus]